jgi:uncharacterized protein DUF4136
LWIISLVFLSGCGSSLSLYSDVDKSAVFDQYTSYNFLDFSEGNKKTITGMELERIRVAFARELEGRGMEFAGEQSDVSVKIIVYHRQALDGYYGYAGRYHYMERAIAVDMYDNKTQKHIWHCAAVGQLENDPEERAAALPLVVAKIFERYPLQITTEI